jgi:ATP-dependent Lon protease
MFVEAAIRRMYGIGQRMQDSEVTKTQVSGWGNVSLILTGQLGDVMKESARAALTYAATHANSLDIPEDRLGSIEVHVHVPAGAIPKDGPSAGVTMSTALVSAMSGRPVRKDVAMTGEISLRGRVMPIGGLKEKVLGAHSSRRHQAHHSAEGQRRRSRGHPGGCSQDADVPRALDARRSVRRRAVARAGPS